MKARTLILALVIVPLLFALPGEKMKAAASPAPSSEKGECIDNEASPRLNRHNPSGASLS